MSVGKPVAAGVHVDLERQRLLGTSDAEPVRGAGASDVPSASASETWTSSRAKASTSSSSTRIKLAASVVAGVCCVLGVAALGGGGLGARGAVRLSGLGDLLDAGFGRDLTPEEQARKNALERAAILCEGDTIDTSDLALLDAIEGRPAAPSAVTLEDIERAAIEEALAAVGGNRKEAAARLGIGLRTLYDRLKRYGESE